MYRVSSRYVSWLSHAFELQLLIKYAVQLLEDEPLKALKPIIEQLVADKDQNTQRAAAELIAGILGGDYGCGRVPISC